MHLGPWTRRFQVACACGWQFQAMDTIGKVHIHVLPSHSQCVNKSTCKVTRSRALDLRDACDERIHAGASSTFQHPRQVLHGAYSSACRRICTSHASSNCSMESTRPKFRHTRCPFSRPCSTSSTRCFDVFRRRISRNFVTRARHGEGNVAHERVGRGGRRVEEEAQRREGPGKDRSLAAEAPSELA